MEKNYPDLEVKELHKALGVGVVVMGLASLFYCSASIAIIAHYFFKVI